MRSNQCLANYFSPPPRSHKSPSYYESEKYFARAHLLANRYKKQRLKSSQKIPHNTEYYDCPHYDKKQDPQAIVDYLRRELQAEKQMSMQKLREATEEVEYLKKHLEEKVNDYNVLYRNYQYLQEELERSKRQMLRNEENEKKAINDMIGLKNAMSQTNNHLLEQVRIHERKYANLLNDFSAYKQKLNIQKDEQITILQKKLDKSNHKQPEDKREKFNPKMGAYQYNYTYQFKNQQQVDLKERIRLFEEGQNTLFERINENLRREKEIMGRLDKLEKWIEKTRGILEGTLHRIEFEMTQ